MESGFELLYDNGDENVFLRIIASKNGIEIEAHGTNGIVEYCDLKWSELLDSMDTYAPDVIEARFKRSE